jgi:glycosyltransferase involved in cell wall biosynthesis
MVRRLTKIYHKLFGYGLCENVNSSQFDKNCLLVYIAAPFKGKTINPNHQNQWQARELARIVGEFGYNVDVINFDENIRLSKIYDLVIDMHPGLNKSYKNNMHAHCCKIAYITGSNPSFSNAAESQRLEELFLRRGVRLKPRRNTKPFVRDELETFDAMLFIGNSYNLQTYEEFNIKRKFLVSNTGVDFPEHKGKVQNPPRGFLFLGGTGQVHKGLDLLLEVFSRNKQLILFICSSFKEERDFSKLYHEELFQNENIHPVGFLNIDDNRFQEICSQCCYVVLPSCSEGMAGSVLMGMSLGLIPIVSRECGFPEEDVHIFKECSIDCITETLLEFAGKSEEWIKKESLKASRIVAERYSSGNYSTSVRSALSQVIRGNLS